MTDKVWTVEYCANDETAILGVFSTQEAAVKLWESLPQRPQEGEPEWEDLGAYYAPNRHWCEVVEYPVLREWGAPVPTRDDLYKPRPDHRTGRIVTPGGG